MMPTYGRIVNLINVIINLNLPLSEAGFFCQTIQLAHGYIPKFKERIVILSDSEVSLLFIIKPIRSLTAVQCKLVKKSNVGFPKSVFVRPAYRQGKEGRQKQSHDCLVH